MYGNNLNKKCVLSQKYLDISRKRLIFAENFLKTANMTINHRLRTVFFWMMLFASSCVSAQTPECKDTAEHRRLEQAMWDCCAQDSAEVLYQACVDFQNHARADGDMFSAYTAWVSGVMYNLGRMNIQDAYHITQVMKEDIKANNEDSEERYFVPNMMGHVYNTCGNIPGALEEFQKSVELIKGTKYEKDGLAFIYLALAHVQLNNDLKESLHWVDVVMQVLDQHHDSWNYYRAMADAYAIKAIAEFKLHRYDAFRQCMLQSDEANRKNESPSSDLFVPYANVYRTLLNGDTEKALEEAEDLPNQKERYLVKCDIYRYIGDNDKAFMTQRELMQKCDSITGVMIAENMSQMEHDIQMMKRGQKMARVLNIILSVVVVLALLFIVLLHRNIFLRRRYNKKLKAKNEELREANRLVIAADHVKTEFIRSMSHEIRTPLNIINGFSKVLSDDENELESEERKSIVRTMSESTRQITSLVNKMQALVNENKTELLNNLDMTDVVDICNRAIKAMPWTDPQRIKVVFDNQIQSGNTRLCTHIDSLLQMLGNLLENAVKFTEQGQITLKLWKDKTHFHFTVEDTGCGIPQDKIDTIFDRFTKVDEFKEGLGLGLAYCRETAVKLGGSLTLNKTSDEGTTFTLSLPILLKVKK